MQRRMAARERRRTVYGRNIFMRSRAFEIEHARRCAQYGVIHDDAARPHGIPQNGGGRPYGNNTEGEGCVTVPVLGRL